KLKENDPILAINVLDRAHSKAPIVKQLRDELQEAHVYDLLEQKLYFLQDELTHTQEETSRLLAKIRSFRCLETRLHLLDKRLRIMEGKECEPHLDELDASDVATSADIVEAKIEYLESPKHERLAHRAYAAIVEEREKYKKKAEENWQIVKELEEILIETDKEIEYLQWQLLEITWDG
ncbi:9304_t:CDS:1, partial [Paraglomus brasilianum]